MKNQDSRPWRERKRDQVDDIGSAEMSGIKDDEGDNLRIQATDKSGARNTRT